MNFITLTGYYPQEHEIYVFPESIVAFHRNVINSKSQGSNVYVAGVTVAFQVLETPDEISELLGIVEEPRG